jgi:hypothetical protein
MTFAGIAGHNQPRPALIKWLRTAAFKRGSDTCANQVGRLLLAEGPIRSCFHKADIRANWRPSSAGSKGLGLWDACPLRSELPGYERHRWAGVAQASREETAGCASKLETA